PVWFLRRPRGAVARSGPLLPIRSASLEQNQNSFSREHSRFLQRMQTALLQSRGALAGKHFAGVRDAERIERRPDSLEAFHFRAAEHFGQVIALLDADAMLAGNRAAHLDAHSQNPSGQRLTALQRAGLAAVEQDQGMQ